MGRYQDRLWYSPLVPIWVAMPDLPAVGIIGQINSAQGVIVCGISLELYTIKSCSGIFLSLSISRLLYLWYATLKDNYHSMALTASGHRMVEVEEEGTNT